ncbi:ribosome small subunit-dependent GTPase A, partial [[Mycoplasma] testudinis]|uniref:ribosome small subunit-dependent GTPase A n=1 Tax=[Mycoplasma] testudinis TaxID=33924 RepID=UPI00055C6B1A
MQAVILKLTANQITVWFQNKKHLVFAPNKWKQQRALKAGDLVDVDVGVSGYQIVKLYPAHNCLEKPKVNNIDNLILVVAATQPELNWLQIMRTLAYYEMALEFLPTLVFTKLDLTRNDVILQSRMIDLKKIGYEVFDKNTPRDHLLLKNKLANKVSCFVGQSGVGKSSLINSFDSSIDLRSATISLKLNRGKNTTTQTQLIPFLNGFLVDTPGYSKFLYPVSVKELSQSFHDFRKLKAQCKYSDCLHMNEVQCAIKAQINKPMLPQWRYDCYVKMLQEV